MSTITDVAALIKQTIRSFHVNAKNMDYRYNRNGASVISGDVLIQDTANARSVKATTTEADTHQIFVVPQIDDVDGDAADQTIADTVQGWFQFAGYIAKVKVTGVVAIGDYLIASTTTKLAKSCGTTWQPGVFARAESAAAGPGAGTVSAVLMPAQSGASTADIQALIDACLPTVATLWHDQSTKTTGNAFVRTLSTSQPYLTFSWQNTSANGDTFTQTFVLKSGTYTLSVLGLTSSASGIIDWYIDDVKVVSLQDWYSGGTVYNVTKTAASIAVATSGRHTLKGVINGKTGSAYDMYLTKMWFT